MAFLLTAPPFLKVGAESHASRLGAWSLGCVAWCLFGMYVAEKVG